MRLDRRTALVALGFVAVARMFPALAAEPDPTAPIRALEAALAGPVKGMPSEAAVRAAVARTFDLDAMARAMLDGHAATAPQFARFRDVLADRLVLDMLDRRRKGGRGTLEIVRTRATGIGQWVVDTRILTPDKKRRSASWRVRDGRGGLLVTDLMGNGASLIRSLRNNHLPSLRKDGLDVLISNMERRNKKMREKV